MLEEEKKAMDEKRHIFTKEYEKYEAKKISEKTAQKEEEKELVLIQETIQRFVEVLLGSMTESAFQLENVLEETEQILETYKSDNNDLRQKQWKAIEMIEEKDEDMEEYREENRTLLHENRKLKTEISMWEKRWKESHRKGKH